MDKGPRVAESRRLGLTDDAFEQRKPWRGQITKREVRAVSLYSLGLRPNSIVWDIGACTGSVAIEAGLIAAQGSVYAIERDPSSLELLARNIQRHGSHNVNLIAGEAPSVLQNLPAPDSVFIGGSGGHLTEILDCVAARLPSGGHLVVNLAALERTQEVYHQLKAMGMTVELVMLSAARGREMKDGTVRLESLNPVFVVSACRQGNPGD